MPFLKCYLNPRANKEDERNQTSSSSEPEEDENWKMITYTILIVTQFVALIIRSGTFFAMCIAASVSLHNSIFSNLVRAPISFFDNTPIGWFEDKSIYFFINIIHFCRKNNQQICKRHGHH